MARNFPGGPARLAGIVLVKVDGEQYKAAGDFTYSLGLGKREALAGPDGVHGYKETPQTPFVEGEIRDHADLDLEAVMTATDVTVTLELANGKVISLTGAWWASDGQVGTADAKIKARFEGLYAEEIR